MTAFGGSVARHIATCTDPDCLFCEHLAESRAEDDEPDYDVEAAENSYERAMFG